MTTPNYPIPAVPEGLVSTLLDVATVTEGSIGYMDGVEEFFDSYNCMEFTQSPSWCAPNSKDFDNAVWQSGFRFAANGGAVCKSVGLDQARQEAEVRRVFEAGESIAVEKAFMEQRFRVGPDNAEGDPIWDAPVDINPAGAVSPMVGIALLEGHAAANYRGRPVFHMPTTIGSLLLNLNALQVEGNVASTRLGSKAAIGAGYDFPNTGPAGTAASAGEKWLYATGGIAIQKAELKIRQNLETTNNDVFTLGERAYVGVVDCYTAAVRVSVTA